MHDVQTDILIIGSGIAALQSARILGQHFNVHIITKSSLYTSSSYRAQGGIAAVTGKEDQYSYHIADTLEAGVYHHHDPHVETLVTHGAHLMKKMIANGLPIDRASDGLPSLGLEGNHSHQRILHAGGDRTGKMFIDYLLTQLPTTVVIHPYELAYEILLNSEGSCIGVKALKDKAHTNYFAHHVIIASGGAAALYPCTSNFDTNTGDGIALAFRAGAAISDMEFMQFHPSLLLVDGEAKGLISEAVRGEGGIFVNKEGKPIMKGVHPLLDLAPRHITAHTLFTLNAHGEKTFIDISAIQNFEKKFPTITELCHEHQVDLEKGLIPVTPGSHFLMGGIVADDCGRTSVKHLYAVGEVACTGVHGANRLASNSLLEGITFGNNLAEHLKRIGCVQKNFIVRSDSSLGILPTMLSKKQLQFEMTQALGIVRDEQRMAKFLRALPTLTELQYCSLNGLNTKQLELYMMHIVARLMAQAAYIRKESRGAHIRTDFKEANPNWAQKWLVFEQGRMKVRKTLYEYHQAREHAEAIFQ